jgi:dolichol kinase
LIGKGQNALEQVLPDNGGPVAATAPFTLQREIVRKLVHVTGLAVPIIYYFVARRTAAVILAAIAVTGIALDLTRHRHKTMMRVFELCFGRVLRAHEKDIHEKRLNAVTWFFIAVTLLVAIFPKYIAIMSIPVALLGDAASALIGRRFGRIRFRDKSLEGSAAFFIVALLTVSLLPKVGHRWEEYLIGAVAALIGTLAELVPTEIVDDNLVVPLSIAGSMWLLYSLLLPGVGLQYGF